MRPPFSALIVAAALLQTAGCRAANPGPPASGEPRLLGTEIVRPDVEEPLPPPAEPPLRDRWNAPFAVSSGGRANPREPRRVVVLGGDSMIEPLDAAADATRASRDVPAAERNGDEPGATPEPTATPPSGTRMHRVQTGDTLWGIARRYNVAPEEIRALNRLADDRVRLGQTLAIPPATTDR